MVGFVPPHCRSRGLSKAKNTAPRRLRLKRLAHAPLACVMLRNENSAGSVQMADLAEYVARRSRGPAPVER